jgi:hypothetical protein
MMWPCAAISTVCPANQAPQIFENEGTKQGHFVWHLMRWFSNQGASGNP